MIKAKQHYKQHYKSIAKAFTACSLVSKLYTRVHQCREKNKNQINLLSTLGTRPGTVLLLYRYDL
jgi:hypothetical protein